MKQPLRKQLLSFTGTCLLLACCNFSWATETPYRDTPVLTLRAQLYIKIGDYSASRQEYERAAAAYLKAAELSTENRPQEQQLSISERLVNVQKLGPAIANLQAIRRAEPENANARLMLARYLGWHNQPRQSAIVADELNATLVNMRFVKPLDEKTIDQIAKNHELIVTIEENAIAGGAGSAVKECLIKNNTEISIINMGLPDEFSEHGARDQILADYGLTSDGMISRIEQFNANRTIESKVKENKACQYQPAQVNS